MRAIGALLNENQARRLSSYLTAQGVDNSCEVSFDPATEHMSYLIWIHDEDKLALASSIFKEFEHNPSASQFDIQIAPPAPEMGEGEEPIPLPPPHRYGHFLTLFLLALCSFIFFLNTVQEAPLRKEGLSEATFLMTPIQAELMFDLPPAFDQLERLIEQNKPTDQKAEKIPSAIASELQRIETAPYWRGAYDWVVLKIKGEDTSAAEGPLFSRIRQGQIWRLFSPCILHSDLLHILFNMLWLWYLGRPVEQRIGPLRTLLLTLVAGIGSNTMQYFMSGPFFIGYSGVITALAGFIWVRERIAPWEGYPLNRSTILFLLFFISAIFGLQVVSFCIQIFTNYNFAPPIANTAHIVGALIGAYLGRFPYFSQRVRR